MAIGLLKHFCLDQSIYFKMPWGGAMVFKHKFVQGSWKKNALKIFRYFKFNFFRTFSLEKKGAQTGLNNLSNLQAKLVSLRIVQFQSGQANSWTASSRRDSLLPKESGQKLMHNFKEDSPIPERIRPKANTVSMEIIKFQMELYWS